MLIPVAVEPAVPAPRSKDTGNAWPIVAEGEAEFALELAQKTAAEPKTAEATEYSLTPLAADDTAVDEDILSLAPPQPDAPAQPKSLPVIEVGAAASEPKMQTVPVSTPPLERATQRLTAPVTAEPEPLLQPQGMRTQRQQPAAPPPEGLAQATGKQSEPQLQEAAMQLSRPTRLRSLPPATAGLFTGAVASYATANEPALPQDSHRPDLSGQNTVSHRPERDTPQMLPQRESWPRSGREKPNASARPTATGQTGGSPTATPTDGALPRRVSAAEARITHQVHSDDLRPATTTSPPPIPQVTAAYAPMAPGLAKPTLKDIQQPLLAPEADVDPILGRSTETLATSVPTAPLKAAAPFVTPEHLANQLAQLAQNTALHRRDIQLNPQELGRIRMNLNAQEASVHVAILVERPETLDLMRRHIGQLTDEFRALGYDDVSFDFAQHQQESGERGAADDGAMAPSTNIEPQAEITPLIAPQPAPAPGQLDLRI